MPIGGTEGKRVRRAILHPRLILVERSLAVFFYITHRIGCSINGHMDRRGSTASIDDAVGIGVLRRPYRGIHPSLQRMRMIGDALGDFQQR